MKNITGFVTAMFICLGVSFAGTDNDASGLRNTNSNNLPLILKKSKKGKGGDDIKGKIILTAGVGFNTTAAATEVRYAASSFYSTNQIGSFSTTGSSSIPLINVMVDYGIGKKITLGLGFGYQTMKINWTDGVFNYVDSWSRIAIALRGDYRILARENIGMYTGLRVGYNIYSMTSTYTQIDPKYPTELNVSPTAVAVQAHFGFSYYFSGLVGVNAEVGLALGGPYFAAVGVTVKI